MRRLLAVLAIVITLPAAALMAGAVPLPASAPTEAMAAADQRHRIYVLSNGFHAGIALPADTMLANMGGERGVMAAIGLDEAHHPVDPDAVRYWLFGWGSRTAYTSLREVRDLTVGIAARALAFDEAVMHVQPLGDLGTPRPGLYAIDVSDDQLSALTGSIAGWFADREPYTGVTQGVGDRFFAGRGRFTPWHSCNAWAGRRLREAGIGVGHWTPLAQTLEFGLARVAADQAR
ncbi:MAG: DUF2459 domain-containing protein [Roseitalea sp.]|jgi:uncharacterized protein (TIGR02117 family)|nr:DUF2459 domain-containing protein [Roseitalea sp.]MBO6723145.1 DUF2459 domain-containing protein [Roseitalea sp.]MBO6744649.1 DUF2459 domain-containing protein [Roseitalea sp.]